MGDCRFADFSIWRIGCRQAFFRKLSILDTVFPEKYINIED
jgi:hypothetical protein